MAIVIACRLTAVIKQIQVNVFNRWRSHYESFISLLARSA